MLAVLRSVIRLAQSLFAPRPASRNGSKQTLQLEELELRTLLSVAAPGVALTPLIAAAAAPYTPAQIRHAYGFDKLSYDGSGQTIAIVDAFDDPNVLADLRTFDRTFGLANPPSFIKATPEGAPKSDPVWAGEISLDVQWAHAVAPQANILLVEAASSSLTDLMNAVRYARSQPGVVVVSISWGASEWSGETAFDSIFTTPPGHVGVAFTASAGDSGAQTEYPAVSPDVLAVGGTRLTLTTANVYVGETAWRDGGGGRSLYEGEPSYQRAFQGSGKRTSPDVAYNADPNTGYYVYDNVPDSDGAVGWFAYGGTSAGAPQWAGLIALADQGRAAAGFGSLTNVAAAVYALPTADFHDIVSGSNGFSAAPGYDLATGRGSPRADLIIPALVASGSATSNHTSTTSAAKPSTKTGTPHAVSVAAKPAAFVLDVKADWTAAELLRDLHAARRSEEAGNPLDER
jgi:subtilase family serine protease